MLATKGSQQPRSIQRIPYPRRGQVLEYSHPTPERLALHADDSVLDPNLCSTSLFALNPRLSTLGPTLYIETKNPKPIPTSFTQKYPETGAAGVLNSAAENGTKSLQQHMTYSRFRVQGSDCRVEGKGLGFRVRV